MINSGILMFKQADDLEIAQGAQTCNLIQPIDPDELMKNIARPYIFITLKQFNDKPVQLDSNNEFRAIQNSSRVNTA